ncbi:hypothetical protein LEP1GSC193_1939 [Leptospira alstonii serovar Pingchang str. 80-412]|uniref:Uncharacterized protein n=2 Tax=Leptospira alstonii TaxID=28452 RepID=M6CXD9_9LEPT|nr:hypothetical protein LEP1GSC194_1755 [Leptospira alstonii serovar Sichuan str. 79601]EQA81490.1 hypothetical protein LEP1GSC193_1939 [Leptospira alstonii serovar Pingchang str. 80-412]
MSIEYSASIRLTSSQIQTIEDSILRNGNYTLFEPSSPNRFKLRNVKYLGINNGIPDVEIVQNHELIISFRVSDRDDREEFLSLVISALAQKGIHCVFEEI